MKDAVVFDWDGTLISCEEKIDFAIQAVCQTHPEIKEVYERSVREQFASPGWIRNGYISALPEDYFTYHFGLLATLMVETLSITSEEAWLKILTIFKKKYWLSRAKLLVRIRGIFELSQVADIYVISNSETDNIEYEAMVLGISKAPFKLVGGAKKYKVSGDENSIVGIPTDRPDYRKILLGLRDRHKSLTVVGDNFSLDLVTPLSLGMDVAYIPNPLTPTAVLDYVRKENIPFGMINVIVERLKTNLGISP